jgi:hypothetical protein
MASETTLTAAERAAETAPTLDEDAPTPDTVIVRALPAARPRARGVSDKKVTITETAINSRGCIIVRVEDSHGREPEGIFETVFYTRRELRAYLLALDHAVFPTVLELPAKWQALIQ